LRQYVDIIGLNLTLKNIGVPRLKIVRSIAWVTHYYDTKHKSINKQKEILAAQFVKQSFGMPRI